MTEVKKRGPGRPRKNPLPDAPRRGRKPGSTNKTWTTKALNQLARIDEAAGDLYTMLDAATKLETDASRQMAFKGALAQLTAMHSARSVVEDVMKVLPVSYVPGAKPVPMWAVGATVMFREDLREAFSRPDAYDIVGLVELGKGNGNGTWVKLSDGGVYPKSHLELVDPEGMEEVEAAPVTAPIAPKANGAATAVAAQVAAPKYDDDVLNA